MTFPHSIRFAVCLLGGLAANVLAQDVVAPAPPGQGATTVYRQVMPDGRVVYSDKLLRGGKLDHTINVEPPIKGNLWSTESGNPAPKPLRGEAVQVKPVASIPEPGKRKTVEEATSDVIRAEMLLEDARTRQREGVEPLPGERTGTASGGSRLNDAYAQRQEALAKQVNEARDVLDRAIAERDALRNNR